MISTLSANCGHCHALRAEVMALNRGIQFRNLHITKLEVHLDSLTCLQILGRG